MLSWWLCLGTIGASVRSNTDLFQSPDLNWKKLVKSFKYNKDFICRRPPKGVIYLATLGSLDWPLSQQPAHWRAYGVVRIICGRSRRKPQNCWPPSLFWSPSNAGPFDETHRCRNCWSSRWRTVKVPLSTLKSPNAQEDMASVWFVLQSFQRF